MEAFNASMVREKIVLTDGQAEIAGMGKEAVVIRSNRIFMRLGIPPVTEKIVVRAQNMHSTLRLTAKILHSYYHGGLLLDRKTPLDFPAIWDACMSAYEKEYSPDIWAAVYINGKSIFKTQSSPFVDVIEKCALLSIDNYDATMEVTESALKQIGHAMNINHSSNVATTFADDGDSIRCGIIQRSEGHDRTFNFTVSGGAQHERVVQSVNMVAGWLELFNLRFKIELLQDKIRRGDVGRVSPETAQIRAAVTRQTAIVKAISHFEGVYNVMYRPEKPDPFAVE